MAERKTANTKAIRKMDVPIASFSLANVAKLFPLT